MKPLIAVCGSDGDDEKLNEKILKLAEEVGAEIAKRGCILICGGRSGVMEAACKGAKREGGTTVGILPFSKSEANPYIDIAIESGLGHFRNYVIVSSADAVIGICGRWGTLNEISTAIILGKPTILIEGSGGVVDDIVHNKLLKGVEGNYHVAQNAKDAVDVAFRFIKDSRGFRD
ncbi:MAG: TIGR00725 family protein [Thermoplasmata archaeon]|nr:MAG: TIGR00725 family protein [Thermoplasmata archaeon]RLF52054.1 MAG: TIGR00725 family protein [Thermoplasmata archaeon]